MALNVDYKGVEVGTLTVQASPGTLIAGRAVAMTSTGVGQPVASGRVLGLVKEHLISGVLDEINGQFGIYGAKRASVLMSGVATVQNSVINGTSYNVYDTTLTYALGDVIFATVATGVLTNAAPGATSGMVANGLTSSRVGQVLSIPTNPANGDPMQLSVFCGN